MRLEQYTQPFASSFYKKYLEDTANLSSFFHYEWNQTALNKRFQEADFSKHKRTELAEVITSFMSKYGISVKSSQHIDELRNNGVVVIGGQQAGILSGPLYSIHKAISVIALAKQQREILGVPVIPVFWIAGEDHDIDEINHVYIERSRTLQKLVYPEKSRTKKIASESSFDQQLMDGYLNEIFKSLPETLYTKKLKSKVMELLENNLTYTSFFTALMNELFQEEGLLLIDAAYKPLRKLESDYFQLQILHAPEIANAVFEHEGKMEQQGYGTPIQAKESAAHLFYIVEGERFLLERVNNLFINEAKGLSFTLDELMEIARENPEQLSNNVVTRPIMQEMVFPVLSFIAGPGEIAYWGTLKTAFEIFGMKMPVLMPRISISIVDAKTQSLLEKLSFTIEEVWDGTLQAAKLDYINNNRNEEIPHLIIEIKKDLKEKYDQLEKLLINDGLKLSPLLQKNLANHEKQLKFIDNAIEDTFLSKLDATINRYDYVSMSLVPNGGLQERTYTPIQLLNEYGPNLIEKLLEVTYEFNGKHHVIYL
ncbi:bacillithiol biosynthesis cysteine-adding enzyme BshC [Psychrobacillus sp. OK028]|uniref:bacillithiol biosynthesis cysteine-adding enzyme BshC n=1 Tax=Psychrobacillus sp. OK028 TaxID=1884359 RepID=UPI000883249F|nr:bacillithiol biosynthesis cysteine-adding enzyme BshC [Psychrobacillus sp. OK028]SDM51385.1 bacillithiol biosynthesis cysteine-adding enzyme BshC [Psychrobacillus sp. OK028]